MLHNARKSTWLQVCGEEIPMYHITRIYLLFALLCGLALTGCSPTEPTPVIAENPRDVMKSAEEVAATIEQSAAKTRQHIDDQSY